MKSAPRVSRPQPATRGFRIAQVVAVAIVSAVAVSTLALASQSNPKAAAMGLEGKNRPARTTA